MNIDLVMICFEVDFNLQPIGNSIDEFKYMQSLLLGFQAKTPSPTQLFFLRPAMQELVPRIF